MNWFLIELSMEFTAEPCDVVVNLIFISMPGNGICHLNMKLRNVDYCEMLPKREKIAALATAGDSYKFLVRGSLRKLF